MFLISPNIHKAINAKVESLGKDKADETKQRLYAGLLLTFFNGQWKFELYKGLKEYVNGEQK